jgi:hypothetical protein
VPGSSPLDGKGEEPTAEKQELKAISARAAGKGKVPREEMEAVVAVISPPPSCLPSGPNA